MKKRIKKTLFVLLGLFALVVVIALVSGDGDEVKEINTNTVSELGERPYTKENAETNADKYPATVGAGLTNKEKGIKGMPYYFKGEFLSAGSNEAFDNVTHWLIRNKNGYVMPVKMGEDEPEPLQGDGVEVWGTISGLGFTIPDVDNVVGETGQLIMIQYAINGDNIN